MFCRAPGPHEQLPDAEERGRFPLFRAGIELPGNPAFSRREKLGGTTVTRVP